MNRQEKSEEIKSLGESFAAAQIAMCADYRGLTVAQMTDLRRELKASGAVGKVVKNTLAKVSIAEVLKEADAAEREKFLQLFNGPSFVVFANDEAVSPAKVLAKFAKNFEVLELKGAWFEGGFVDQSGIKQLSEMPSKEELFAKLLYLLSAPATQIVRLLAAPATQIARVLDAHRAKLQDGKPEEKAE